jgi:hypothetical protein|tara:strand:+ start:220 stop:864 length:645 start_codon:yes stop_codon:yes gene_type:complete
MDGTGKQGSLDGSGKLRRKNNPRNNGGKRHYNPTGHLTGKINSSQERDGRPDCCHSNGQSQEERYGTWRCVGTSGTSTGTQSCQIEQQCTSCGQVPSTATLHQVYGCTIDNNCGNNEYHTCVKRSDNENPCCDCMAGDDWDNCPTGQFCYQYGYAFLPMGCGYCHDNYGQQPWPIEGETAQASQESDTATRDGRRGGSIRKYKKGRQVKRGRRR